MSRFCLVNEIQEEHIGDYIELHKNAWPEMRDALRKSGAENCVVYVYKNLSILFYECDDIDKSFTALGKDEVNLKWQAITAQWFTATPKFDGSEKTIPVEKVFDLNE
jgi:L-rhamnose mutarotase